MSLSAQIQASGMPREIHSRLQPPSGSTAPMVALTLDACSGQVDLHLLQFLIEQKIPATLFVTQRWLKKNAEAITLIKSAKHLFEIENHGALHRPAILGATRQVYGLSGLRDLNDLQQEVHVGAEAIFQEFAYQARYYRGATARYDQQALQKITSMGYQIAGFSVNADQGASLGKSAILKRLAALKAGDIILAHVNKPRAATGAALITGLSAARQRGFQFVRLDALTMANDKAGPASGTAQSRFQRIKM